MLRRSPTSRLVPIELGLFLFIVFFTAIAPVPATAGEENVSQGGPATVEEGSAPNGADQPRELSADEKQRKEKEAIAREWETDREKPKPAFSRQGDAIIAELIPRGKSSKVTVEFRAPAQAIESVEGMDFETAKRPGVDPKDFRYALFDVKLAGIPPGGEAKVSLRSDFFNASTGFGVFNEKGTPAWTQVKVENELVGGRVREVSFPVLDGGPLDSDGSADGRITLIGGPKDSFWGYAIGTLIIRFFGVFVVLAILLVGMLISGRFMRRLKERTEAPPTEGALLAELGNENGADKAEEFAELVSQVTSDVEVRHAAGEFGAEEAAAVAMALQLQCCAEEAAAVAMALHLHSTAHPAQPCGDGLPDVSEGASAYGPASPWASLGRSRMMSERSGVFWRMKK